jgi:flagellar protein FlhE
MKIFSAMPAPAAATIVATTYAATATTVAGIILGMLALLATAPANADVWVARNLGSTHAPGTPLPAAALLKPGGTASQPSTPANVDGGQQGSYSVNVVGPTMYSKNVVYVTPFPVPAHLNARVTITSVEWAYSTRTQPTGFEAALCWKNGKSCINITRYGTGQSNNFNGLDAFQPFLLQFQVRGLSSLPQPVIGDTAQIVVNYTVWSQ